MIGNYVHFKSERPDTYLVGGPDDGQEVFLSDGLALMIETERAVYVYDSLVQRYIYTKDVVRGIK